MSDKTDIEAENGGESKKKQKNLRLHKDTIDVIESEAESRYGSRKKMGQVVDEMVKEWAGTDDTKVLDKLESIESKLEQGGVGDTHTGGKTHSTGVSEELLEAIESGEVDPQEFDLSQLKGEDATLVRDAIIGVLRWKNSDTYTKKEIQTLIESELGYSVNAARSKRDAVLSKMVDITADVADEIEQALRDEFEAGLWKPINGRREWYVSRDVDSPESTWLNKYNSLEDYIGISIRGDGYALPEQAEVVEDIRKTQLNSLMDEMVDNRDKHAVWRVQAVADALDIDLNKKASFDVSEI